MNKLALMISLGLTASISTGVLAEQPLKQPGKKTLFQRVLSTPTCSLTDQMGGQNGKAVPAFSRYYVYERGQLNGSEWLKVGPDESGKIEGWLQSDCAVPWNTQLTLTFTNPVSREPLLFFKDRETLEGIISADNGKEQVEKIRQNLSAQNTSPEVLAQEPKEFVDFQKNFYLLPVLQGEEVMNNSGFYERMLEVASVTKAEKQAVQNTQQFASATNNTQSSNGQGHQDNNEITGFKAAVVFVIDSTISMDPYINRTRDAVKKLYEKIEKEGLSDQVKFGLVAFRSSTKAVPGLEYTAKMFVDPNKVKDGQDFMAKVANLKQAKVSSKEFSEDAYAGVVKAINDIDWNGFGARYIVLITDAGAIEGNNPISTTGFDAPQLRLEAQHKGVALYTLHLKTPSGAKNHQQAAAQYNDLSFNPVVNKALYYPVNAGDVDEFGHKVAQLADALASQVKQAYMGETSVGSAMNAQDNTMKASANPQANNEIEEDAALLGKAMRLAYLGRLNGQKAPPVFKAWISDRDFAKPDSATAEVRVLLTKAQLSEMSEVVKNIMDAANNGLIAPADMFNQLRSVAAAMGQDPSKVKQGSSTKIADLGLMGEYLEGIPYKSQVTGIDEDTWKSMTVAQQEKFIRDLHSKLRHYQAYNADVDRWISLAEGSDPKDNVYPVPLEALP
ncbi:serine/threonine protein kinase [Pasteurellaceae bacterium Macca]|nr:serine/threonine protein kinase [Pasteurellaceae bacterium Macca]